MNTFDLERTRLDLSRAVLSKAEMREAREDEKAKAPMGRILSAVLPILLLGWSASLPSGVQSVLYFACIVFYFISFALVRISIENAEAVTRRCLGLWTLLLGFSFSFLVLEIAAQIVNALWRNSDTKGDLVLLLRILGLRNSTPLSLGIAICKHFVVLFTSSWQRTVLGQLLTSHQTIEISCRLIEEQKANRLFAKNFAIHLWSFLLLGICLLKLSPLNLPYVMYLTAYSLYTGATFKKARLSVIRYVKIGYLIYSSVYYILLLTLEVAVPVSSEMKHVADALRLPFLTKEKQLGTSMVYLGLLVLSWLFGLYEFSLKYHGDVRKRDEAGLKTPLLSEKDSSQSPEAERTRGLESPQTAEHAPLQTGGFYWCIAVVLTVYSIALSSLAGLLLLPVGLMMLLALEKRELRRRLVLSASVYMSCLWTLVYVLVCTNSCSNLVAEIGVCDAQESKASMWFETHLMSLLPIFSILIMKQTRGYACKRSSTTFIWIHIVHSEISGCAHAFMEYTSPVLVPLALFILSIFCQPHNDGLHAIYICLLILRLTNSKLKLERVTAYIASAHIVLISILWQLNRSDLVAMKCTTVAWVTTMNTCILSKKLFSGDVCLMLTLVLYSTIKGNIRSNSIIISSQCISKWLVKQVGPFFKGVRDLCIRAYASEFGTTIIPLFAVALVHLGAVQDGQHTFIELLWTSAALWNIVQSKGWGLNSKVRFWTSLTAIGVLHLLSQFVFSTFYTNIFRSVANPDKVTTFIERNIGLERNASFADFVVSAGRPFAILMLIRLQSACQAFAKDLPSIAESMTAIEKFVAVYSEMLVALVFLSCTIPLGTLVGVAALACFLVSLQFGSLEYTKQYLLRVCETLVCVSIVATEALRVPCIQDGISNRVQSIFQLVCATNERDYMLLLLLGLLFLSLERIKVNRHDSRYASLSYFTQWPSTVAMDSNGHDAADGMGSKRNFAGKKWFVQIKYLLKVFPYHLERTFTNYNHGIIALLLLLCAFASRNVISIFYMVLVPFCVTKGSVQMLQTLSACCTAIAVYQSTLRAMNLQHQIHVPGISEKWQNWLAFSPNCYLLWSYAIPSFSMYLAVKHKAIASPATPQMADDHKFFRHACWNTVMHQTMKDWSAVEYFMYRLFRYSQDISLIFVVTLAFFDKDLVHIGYLIISLYFFRMRKSLRCEGNKIWKLLCMYNYVTILLNIIYQAPVINKISYHTCNVQNLVGMYKIRGLVGNTAHFLSIRPTSDILLFIVIQIQAHIFSLNMHRTVVECGNQNRELSWNKIHALKQRKMLKKKFYAHSVYRQNESRQMRLRWLKGSVLQRDSNIDNGNIYSQLSDDSSPIAKQGAHPGPGGDPQDPLLSIEGTPSTGRERATSHVRNVSDIPAGMLEGPTNFGTPNKLFQHQKSSSDLPDEMFEEDDKPTEILQTSDDHGSDVKEEDVQADVEEKAESRDAKEVTLQGTPQKPPPLDDGCAPGKKKSVRAKFARWLSTPRADNHNFFCYFCMLVFFVSEFSVASLILPLVLFSYALLVLSPPKSFWKLILTCMEFWLLFQYVWQVPIYNAAVSADSISLCKWVTETAMEESVHFFGLHESASRCLPGFLVYLSCLFHYFIVEDRESELAIEPTSNEVYKAGRFIDRLRLFFERLIKYHEDHPSFVHVVVEGEGVELSKVPKIELGDIFSKYLHESPGPEPIGKSQIDLRALHVEEGNAADRWVILFTVDNVFDWHASRPLLIHPARAIGTMFNDNSDAWLGRTVILPSTSDAAASKEMKIIEAFAAHEDKPDFFLYTFLLDLFAYVFVLLAYQAAVSSNKSLSESFSESIFPADYILALLSLFLLLLLDRAIYVLKSNLARTCLHYFSIVLYFSGGMIMFWQRAKEHKAYICVFMFVKFGSLILSSWQVQKGFPKSTSRNVLLRHYSMPSWLMVVAYTGIPFLYELRSMLDWTCTQTTLTLFDWITMEEIRLTLFNAEMIKQFKSKRPFGKPQPIHVKFFQGLLFFTLLVIVLWTPLLVFSSGSPSFQVPLLTGVNMNVTLMTGASTTNPVQVMPIFDGGNRRSIDESTLSPKQIKKYYVSNQIQCVSVAPSGDREWIASRPSKQAFTQSLLDDSQNAYVGVSWAMIRDHPVTEAACSRTSYAQLGKTSREAIASAIQNASQAANSTDTVIPLDLYDPKTSEAVPGLYRLYWQLNGAPCNVVERIPILKNKYVWVNCSLTLHTEVDHAHLNRVQWWNMDCQIPKEVDDKSDTCWHKTTKEEQTGGPLLKAILQEVQSGVLGTFLSSKGITGLYITFVFVIARLIRGMVSNRILQIQHFELPSIKKLQTLCDDIRAARTEQDMELEELLYRALVRIYRSTELLYEMTRKTD